MEAMSQHDAQGKSNGFMHRTRRTEPHEDEQEDGWQEWSFSVSDMRPTQFLFFCGTEDGEKMSMARASETASEDSIDRQSIQPVLEHRMPVFFASPPRESLRMSSICNTSMSA